MSAQEHLPNPSTRAWRLLALLAIISTVLSALSLTTGQRSAESAAAVPIYDTAWDLPFWATQSEAATYFDHLSNAGYTGVWLSLFNHTGGGMTAKSRGAGAPTAKMVNGQFQLDAGYTQHVRKLLDLAHARGLEVGMVPIWGVFYINDLRQGCQGGGSKGPLKDYNSYWLGQQVGKAFADHPALDHWIMGGDNFCNFEDVNIWRNLAAGLESEGGSQPTTYHTPGLRNRHTQFANEGWLDFLSPQTGHCVSADTAYRDLLAVVNSTNKPVWAAEMRYEGIQPDWDPCPQHGPGNAPNAYHIDADVKAALRAGVDAIMFGNNDRWQWASGALGSNGKGTSTVFSTFWSPGEKAFLKAVGASGPTPTTTAAPTTTKPAPATTAAPTSTKSLIVIKATGLTGTEMMQLKIDGNVVATYKVPNKIGSPAGEFHYTHPSTVTPGRVRVQFINDFRNADGSFDRNLHVEGITVDGDWYASTNAAVYSEGGFTRGTGCKAGNKSTEILACAGFFQYADVAPTPKSSAPNTTVPKTTVPKTGVVDPGTVTGTPPSSTAPSLEAPAKPASPAAGPDSILHIYAAGNNGDEVMDLKIDGKVVATWIVGGDINTPKYHEFTYKHIGPLQPEQIRLRFTNDLFAPPIDRNLRVDRIVLDGVVHQTEGVEVKSKGSWRPGSKCAEGYKQAETLHCNGWFQYN